MTELRRKYAGKKDNYFVTFSLSLTRHDGQSTHKPMALQQHILLISTKQFPFGGIYTNFLANCLFINGFIFV